LSLQKFTPNHQSKQSLIFG